MVANRLRKNRRRLNSWCKRTGATCYRVYDADLPEYSAAVDLYQEAEGARRTFLHVQEYQAPAHIPEEKTRRRLDELVAAVLEVFEIPRAQLACKTRARGKGGSKYGRFGRERRIRRGSGGPGSARSESFRLPGHGALSRSSAGASAHRSRGCGQAFSQPVLLYRRGDGSRGGRRRSGAALQGAAQLQA